MEDYENVFQVLEAIKPLIQGHAGQAIKAQFMEAGLSEQMASSLMTLLILEMFKKTGNGG